MKGLVFDVSTANAWLAAGPLPARSAPPDCSVLVMPPFPLARHQEAIEANLTP